MKSRDSQFVLDGLDRFVVQQRLGRGGFGEVFRAWDQKLGRTVALKLLRQHDPQAHLQLAGEFSRIQSIKHPHLVDLLELLYVRRRPILVVEYLPDAVSFPSGVRDDIWDQGDRMAMSMTTIAATRRLLVEEELHQPPGSILSKSNRRRFFLAAYGVLLGLEALHSRGLVHRDIKPSNVVISAGRPVILDYGLAADDGDRLIEMAGTAGYIAPEIFGEYRATRRGDIYSLGMLFARSLLGRLPNRAQRANPQGLYAELCDDPSYEPFFEMLGRATSVTPEERPTVEEFIVATEQALGDTSALRSTSQNPYFSRSQSKDTELAHEICESVAQATCLLEGPAGSGRTFVVQQVIALLANDEDVDEVVRVDAINGGFGDVLPRIVHLGAEWLSTQPSVDALPVRALRLSNQLAARFPVVEASLESLGAPRQFGVDDRPHAPSKTGDPTPAVVAQWLRTLFEGTRWVFIVERFDLADPAAVLFLEALHQPGAFSPCHGTIVTSDVHPVGLEQRVNVRSFFCRPMRANELSALLKPLADRFPGVTLEEWSQDLAALTRGFRRPSALLSDRILERLESGGADRSPRDEIARVWLDPLSADARLLLWLVAASQKPWKLSWTHALFGDRARGLIRELLEVYLLRRLLVRESPRLIPYSSSLGELACERLRDLVAKRQDLDSLFEKLSSTAVEALEVVARLHKDLGRAAEASAAYRGGIRRLLRSHRYEEAKRLGEEFLEHAPLQRTDVEALASLFIHCRRPLKAATVLERFAEGGSFPLVDVAHRLRIASGERLAQSEVSDKNHRSLAVSKEAFLTLSTSEPAIRSLVEFYQQGEFFQTIEAAKANRWVDIAEPATLVRFLRAFDYVVARSCFLTCTPNRATLVPREFVLHASESAQQFQWAVDFLTTGWLTAIQTAGVGDVVARINEAVRVIDERTHDPDLHRLAREARAVTRIHRRPDEADVTPSWLDLANPRTATLFSEFFKARDTARDQDAKAILRRGFRRAFHQGTNLVAMSTLMLFGQAVDERIAAEEELRKAGWKEPHVAACLVYGRTREEIQQLHRELAPIDGIRMPPSTTFDVRSFVGVSIT